MKLYKSRFVFLTDEQLAAVLADASGTLPNAFQAADQFSGYGLHISLDPRCVVIWDRKRIWILSATGWINFYQRPTTMGSMYVRLGFEDMGKINFDYAPVWNEIIPVKVSEISRRYWNANPVPNQRHF